MRNPRFALVAILVAHACAAMAQSDSLRLREMDEVEVEAVRPKDAHALGTLHSLTQADALSLGIADMADALRRMPGLTLRDYGGAGGRKSIAIRGLGSEHSGVSYDGVTLTECQTGSIDLSRYALEQAREVSLTLGDEGSLLVPARQLAYPAVLSIQTVDAAPGRDRKAHLKASIQAGSYGRVRPFVRYTQQVSQRWKLSTTLDMLYAKNNFSYTIRNGQTTQTDRRTNSALLTGHGELDAIRHGEHSEMRLKAYAYADRRELPGQVRYYTNVSGENLREQNTFAQWQYAYYGLRQLSLRALAKYNYHHSDYRDRLSPTAGSLATYDQQEAYASLMAEYRPLESLRLAYAADYAFANLWSSLQTVTRPQRHTMLHALSARYSWRGLDVQARLLGSFYFNADRRGPAARNAQRLSPSLLLRYQVPGQSGLTLRAGYKDIFRVPTFNELYYYHYGSTDLKPENTRQLNLGLGWSLQDSRHWQAELSLDAFANRVTDKIVAIPYNLFIWRTVNLAKVSGRGLEFTGRASWRPSSRHALNASLGGSLQRIANRTNPEAKTYDLQIAYIPERMLNASLGWDNPWLSVVVSTYASSAFYSTNDHVEGTRVDGFAELNLSLHRRWQWQAHALMVKLDLRNLTNKQYELVARYPMPRRQWMLSVSAEF